MELITQDNLFAVNPLGWLVKSKIKKKTKMEFKKKSKRQRDTEYNAIFII